MNVADTVPAAEFMRDLGCRTLAGYFVAPHEYEKLLRFRCMRQRFRTAELPDNVVDAVASTQMDPRHDHLNALLDPS